MRSALLLSAALIGLPSAAALAQTQPAPTQSAATSPASTQPQDPSPQTTAAPEGEVTVSADGEPATQETVVVTGTRIPRPSFEGTIPGAQVGRADIENRGFTNALDILNDVPLVGFGTSINTNGGQPSSLGVGFVDLLDLGTQRTLTLVNGRRFVSANSATLFVASNATGSQVDVTSLPVSLIERVDVLTVGGAAAYGTDAIAGVVNYILKTDYEGFEVSGVAGVTQKGDGETYSFRALAGTNFLDGRGNVAVSYEYNKIEDFTADQRNFLVNNPGALTSYLNGTQRNAAYNPNALTGGANTPFLPAASDSQPGIQYLLQRLNPQYTNSGVIYQLAAGQPTSQAGFAIPGATGQVGPVGSIFGSTTQLINGGPVACQAVSAADGFCAFAPSALPTGVTAAQVFARYGVTPAAGATAAQLNAQALSVLQANRPTLREYFAANPGTDINKFLGTFIANYPDIANTGADAGLLPRIAVPIQFNAAGQVVPFTVAQLDPNTPSTTGVANGGDGFNSTPYTIIRAQQKRQIGNAFGHFKLIEESDWNVEFFTENLYSEVKTRSPRDLGGLTNSAAGSTAENAPLIMSINNPFLDATDRAALNAAGITGNFVLGRSNADIFGDNPSFGESDTFRTVLGLRGDFQAIDRKFNWEASFFYGKVESEVRQGKLLDVEYNLALDSAINPLTNQIVCSAQLNPAAYLGKVLPGVAANIIRVPGADGLPTETIYAPAITQDQIDRCRPLNPFGYGQMSEDAKNYVRSTTLYKNESKQTGGQLVFGGEIVQLPAGPLAFSLSGEYRKEELDFSTDEVNRVGRTRSAPSAQTRGETETYEWGGELLIPVFRNSDIIGLHTLEFNPSARYSKQSGSAPSYRSLAGTVVEQEYEGDVERVFSLAATYKPIQDITFRGNITRSIRNPSVVELFLGNQPSFINAFTDPCSNSQINSGPSPALRRANCLEAVNRQIAAGNLPGVTDAATFLNSFVPTGASIQGGFSGQTSLEPEKAESWTAGVVLEPRFLKGFRASADYIEIELKGQINPTNVNQVLQFCFDGSANLGDANCSRFSRDGTFNLTNGFQLGFQNLAVTKLRAYNFSAEYRTPVEDLVSWAFGEGDYGDFSLKTNAYHLVRFESSSSGTFTDTIRSDGDIVAGRPEWEVQTTARYFNGPFDASVTWNYQNDTAIFASGVASTIEQNYFINVPGFHLFSASLGYELGGDDDARTESADLESRIANARYRVQLTVDNIFNEQVYGGIGNYTGANYTGYIDQLGRRYLLTLRAQF